MCGGAGGGRAGNSIEKLHLDRRLLWDLRTLESRVPGEYVPQFAFDSQPCLRGFVRHLTAVIEDLATNVRALNNGSNTRKRIVVKRLLDVVRIHSRSFSNCDNLLIFQ